MPKQKKEETTGVVTEALPDATFRVKVEDGRELLCHLAGKMRMYHIRVMPGDKVRIELTPYDETKGRIVYREK